MHKQNLVIESCDMPASEYDASNNDARDVRIRVNSGNQVNDEGQL